jgi:hypothetical protein
MTPEEIARAASDRAWAQHDNQAAQRQLSRRTAKPIESGTYQGYDADTERHTVTTRDGQTQARAMLTNGGLAEGDPVEFVGENLDAIPRPRPRTRPRRRLQGQDPAVAALVKRRSLARTESVYVPPSPAVYSDPIPAQWRMVYSAYGFVPDNWDSSAARRYTPGTSNELCGSQYGDEYDLFCRSGLPDWVTLPDSVMYDFGYGGNRCHYSFMGLINGFPAILGGTVIAIQAASPDGISEEPTEPPEAFPVVQYRILNPDWTPYNGLPKWSGCGAEKDMEWFHVETFQTNPYIPPELIKPAFPGGTLALKFYQTEIWLVSSGAAPVLVYSAEDLHSGGVGQKQIESWLALDEQGTAHVDLKVVDVTEDSEGNPIGTIALKHYQIQGQKAEVSESASWRQALTNSPTNAPLPGPLAHPCIGRFQFYPNVNLSTTEQKIYSVKPAPSYETLAQAEGISLTVESRPLLATDSGQCDTTLETTVEEELTVSLRLTPADLGVAATDAGQPEVLSFVGILA